MLVKSKVKYIQSLGHKKFRNEERLFIAEGPKMVKELIEADAAAIREIYAVKEWIDENKGLLTNVEITEISEIELERISQLATPNKVVAVLEQYENEEPAEIKDTIILALDNIQDPGNLGTIIRIADWFGVKQIVCSMNTAELFNPKVIQATMGSIARIKIYYTELDQWLAAQKDSTIYAATLDGSDVSSVQKIKEGIIIIGNESKGISHEVMQLANKKITINKKGKAESLNAAVAAGILLSHLS